MGQILFYVIYIYGVLEFSPQFYKKICFRKELLNQEILIKLSMLHKWWSKFKNWPSDHRSVLNTPATQEPQKTRVPSLGQEDPLEEDMAILSSILTLRIPQTLEPVELQSTGSQRVGHDWASELNWNHFFLTRINFFLQSGLKIVYFICMYFLKFKHHWFIILC